MNRIKNAFSFRHRLCIRGALFRHWLSIFSSPVTVSHRFQNFLSGAKRRIKYRTLRTPKRHSTHQFRGLSAHPKIFDWLQFSIVFCRNVSFSSATEGVILEQVSSVSHPFSPQFDVRTPLVNLRLGHTRRSYYAYKEGAMHA